MRRRCRRRACHGSGKAHEYQKEDPSFRREMLHTQVKQPENIKNHTFRTAKQPQNSKVGFYLS